MRIFSLPLLMALVLLTSCVSMKRMKATQTELDNARRELAKANQDLGQCGLSLNDYMNRLSACEREKQQDKLRLEEQSALLRAQIADLQIQRNQQISQVSDLTNLSQSATANIRETLAQLERKDKYIALLQRAKSKADSINLALAINLTSVLRDGLLDEDFEVTVYKTLVFVYLSDKMLFQSGSANLTPRAQEVLGKVAQIVQSRPDLEVMVEGYTDNVPIKNACMDDNWDLSVKRSTAVVRVLQSRYKVDPDRLIAAGRGEYNTLASNATDAGRAMNRRTRIIIMPKLDQFYDLLDPKRVPTN